MCQGRKEEAISHTLSPTVEPGTSVVLHTQTPHRPLCHLGRIFVQCTLIPHFELLRCPSWVPVFHLAAPLRVVGQPSDAHILWAEIAVLLAKDAIKPDSPLTQAILTLCVQGAGSSV